MIQQRFWSKVKTVESGCMEWQGSFNLNGYGRLKIKGKTHYAHRLALKLSGIFLADDLFAIHSCDNKWCVNPLHLRPGTPAENTHDMISRGRQHEQKKTHCPSGHEYSGDNLIITKSNSRLCRECQRQWQENFTRSGLRKEYNSKRKERAALSRLKGGSNECTNKN